MDIFTAMLFTTTIRSPGIAETVTKLKDISECQLIIKKRMEQIGNINTIYINQLNVKSFRYSTGSDDLVRQNLQCVDLTETETTSKF